MALSQNIMSSVSQVPSFTDALNALFKLKIHERAEAVVFIIERLSRVINNPNKPNFQKIKYALITKKIADIALQQALSLLNAIGFITIDNTTQDLQINIQTNDERINLINMYNKVKYKHNDRATVHRQEFDCNQLMTQFPPKYKDGRKKAVFKLIVPNGASDCNGTLIYGRHQLIDLPKLIPDPTDFILNRIKIEPNIYKYVCNTANTSEEHFYVNFADANLFGFYNGSLFAQDELMTMEQPILASLREKLLFEHSKNNSKGKLIPYCRGSVIVLNSIKHGNFTQKKLKNIYGGRFGRSTIDKIKKSVDICNPVIYNNIICMASLMGMLHKYKKQQIEKLMKTAYCGFNGAKVDSMYQSFKLFNKQNDNDNDVDQKNDDNDIDIDIDIDQKNDNNDICGILKMKRIIVHTGNWGCGAFGGNIEVHTMLQIIAAVAADVDMMYYHSVDKKSMKKAQTGCKVLLQEIYPKCKNKKGKIKRDAFVAELLKKGYKWGTPNGT